MDRPAQGAVDVSDMLCAQALAMVARAVARLPVGAILTVRYNADDVQRDLLSWSREQGLSIVEVGPRILRLANPSPQ